MISNQDKWLVLSPGRTGSKVIVDCLRSYYYDRKMFLDYIGPNRVTKILEENLELPNLAVYHSHKYKTLEWINLGFKVIISTRDTVECALSWCIQPQLHGLYHLYEKQHPDIIKDLKQEIPQFYLDPEELLRIYDNINLFYADLDKNLLKQTVFIDYTEFSNNPKEVYKKLNLEAPKIIARIPIKNPGEHKDWILNWSEIEGIISKLDRIPKI